MAEVTTLKLSGLDGVLELLRKLPPEVVSKRGGPVRRSAFKGIKVIRDKARVNLRAAIAQAGKTGITDTTGFTEKQVIARRKTPPRGENGEYYLLTLHPKKHPNAHKYGKRLLQANDVAYMMELGTAKQPATPWLRPAYNSGAEEAINVASTSLVKDLDGIVRKLTKQGGLV